MSVPVYDRHGIQVHHGDCLRVLAQLPDASIDAVVTDPPYGLEFMGKDWDSFKPGGKQPKIGEADGSPHRRNTGTPSWSASGNPSGLNCGGSKYHAGERRCRCAAPRFPNEAAAHMRAFQGWSEAWAAECLRVLKPGGHLAAFGGTRTYHRLTSGIEDAGFEIRDSIGTPLMAWVYGSGFPKGKGQLKPAWEPIVLARKPLAGTVAANALAHGTGAINVDACRVAHGDDLSRYDRSTTSGFKRGGVYGDGEPVLTPANAAGRWPANVVLVHGEACTEGGCVDGCLVAELDSQSGVTTSGSRKAGEHGLMGYMGADVAPMPAIVGDSGGASRFFPVFRWESKAPTAERPQVDGVSHPTVKPLDLMRWLVRLVTPPGGTVLDPFAGSGTTLQAARAEGFRAIGIEREPTYLPLIKARLDARARTTAAPATTKADEPMDLLDLLEGGAA